MLRRFIVHLCLILMFAFVQAGVVTHEISHLSAHNQQSNPDKQPAAEHCEQCIANAQFAGSLPSVSFFIPLNTTHFHFATSHVAVLASALTGPYSARAPPALSII